MNKDTEPQNSPQPTTDNKINIDIIQPEWAQVDPEQLDNLTGQILGRISGPLQNTKTHTIGTKTSDEVITLSRPRETRFVLVLTPDSKLEVMRYDIKNHGLWPDIPDTGLSTSQLYNQLEGFGETETTEGQKFQNERKKRRARKTHWSPNHHPPIQNRKK